MARLWVMPLMLAPLLAWGQGEMTGDPEAGEQKASECAACHGMDGNSTVARWPKLAGQHAEYTARQTRLIRDGVREVAEMEPTVEGLSDKDIADMAAFYAEQTVEPGVADEALVEAGRKLYQGGNPETGVPACAACHGPTGDGIAGAHFPMLRAQHADYLENRLRAYRDGESHGEDDSYSEIMVAVSGELTDEEIQAVSSYIEGLHMDRW